LHSLAAVVQGKSTAGVIQCFHRLLLRLTWHASQRVPGLPAEHACKALSDSDLAHVHALLSELCQAALASQVVRMCLFTGEAADAVHSASAAIGTLCEGAVDRRLMQ